MAILTNASRASEFSEMRPLIPDCFKLPFLSTVTSDSSPRCSGGGSQYTFSIAIALSILFQPFKENRSRGESTESPEQDACLDKLSIIESEHAELSLQSDTFRCWFAKNEIGRKECYLYDCKLITTGDPSIHISHLEIHAVKQ
jgi:hypothetical protein